VRFTHAGSGTGEVFEEWKGKGVFEVATVKQVMVAACLPQAGFKSRPPLQVLERLQRIEAYGEGKI
jgi:hypothetical protein